MPHTHQGTIHLYAAHRHWSNLRQRRRRHMFYFTFLVIISLVLGSLLVLTLMQTRASNVNFSLVINGADVCGDAVVDADEFCDDGTARNGTPNYCNDLCSAVTAPICGNIVSENGEQCDDGNTTNGDGCSAQCQTETGGGGSSGGGGGGYISPTPIVLPLPRVEPKIKDPEVPPSPPSEPLTTLKVRLIDEGGESKAVNLDIDSAGRSIPIMSSRRPTVRGVVGVPFALIRILVRSEIETIVIQADAKGAWQWRPQKQLTDGPHDLFLTVYSADGGQVLIEEFVIHFIVDASHSGKFVDDVNKILEQLQQPDVDKAKLLQEGLAFESPIIFESLGEYIAYDMRLSTNEQYRVGEVIRSRLVMNHYSQTESPEQQLTYTVYSQQGEAIWQHNLLHTVQRQNNIQTDLELPFNLKPGVYQLTVTFPYGPVTAVSSASFFVTPLASPLLESLKINWSIVLQTIIAFFLMALLAVYFEYRLLQGLGRLDHPISENDLRHLGYLTKI